MAIHKLQEAVAVALHAEGIGEAEGHFSPVGPRHFSGGDEGLFGVIAVPQVALQVEHLGLGHHLQVEVCGIQAHRCPEVGAHGALGIGGDQDQAAGRRGSCGGRWRFEAGAHRANVVGKDRPKLVVPHPANEAGPAAQLGDARQGVGG